MGLDRDIIVVQADMAVETDLQQLVQSVKNRSIGVRTTGNSMGLCPWRRLDARTIYLSRKAGLPVAEAISRYCRFGVTTPSNLYLCENALTYGVETTHAATRPAFIDSGWVMPFTRRPVFSIMETNIENRNPRS